MDGLGGGGWLGVGVVGGAVGEGVGGGFEEVFKGLKVLVLDGGGEGGFDEVVAGDDGGVGALHGGGALVGGIGLLA